MFLSLLIFAITILMYIYICHQWKCNDGLEVFEMDYVENHAHLQEACELRQPVLFPWGDPVVHVPKHAATLDISIRDARDYYSKKSLDSVEMSLERGQRFLAASPPHYFSEGNSAFLQDSGILRGLDFDAWFKPTFTISSDYDLLLGGATVKTPFRYHTKSRRFLWAMEEDTRIRLVPPHALNHKIQDFEFYEFYSTSPTSDKTIEVVIPTGHALFVPAYWWYSVEFATAKSRVIQCSYMTAMNALAHSWDLARYWLQHQRITRVYNNKRQYNLNEECIDAAAISQTATTEEKDQHDPPVEAVRQETV
jgi:hypothetical protein